MSSESTATSVSAHDKRRFGLGALLFAAACGGALAAAGTWQFLQPHHAGSHTAETGVLYQCPMHPAVVRDHPDNCPICGMKLERVDRAAPKATAEHEAHDVDTHGLTTVEIDPVRQQLIGLKTIEVGRGPVAGSLRSVGRVAIDETRIRNISLKVPGFVERVYVDFVGKRVAKHDPLFSIYSPELFAAQAEYVLALKTENALTHAGAAKDGAALVQAARRKLALWDVPDAAVEELARTGVPQKTLTFNSPIAGVVTKKAVVEGMRLDVGAMPYEIVDLSSVWVLADVYESELRFVKPRMAATLKLNAFPDREWKGKVVFLDPLLDAQTRTVKLRLTFPNPSGDLRPEMFGEVVLSRDAREVLRVPADAVIDSGTDKLVFVALGAGKFQPRQIELGEGDREFMEVVSGLSAGERVVARANFLIDSESRLRASLAEMAPQAHEHAAPERAQALPPSAAPVGHTP